MNIRFKWMPEDKARLKTRKEAMREKEVRRVSHPIKKKKRTCEREGTQANAGPGNTTDGSVTSRHVDEQRGKV